MAALPAASGPGWGSISTEGSLLVNTIHVWAAYRAGKTTYEIEPALAECPSGTPWPAPYANAAQRMPPATCATLPHSWPKAHRRAVEDVNSSPFPRQRGPGSATTLQAIAFYDQLPIAPLQPAPPPSEAYIELFSNWDEVMWAGADGEVAEFKARAGYAADPGVADARSAPRFGRPGVRPRLAHKSQPRRSRRRARAFPEMNDADEQPDCGPAIPRASREEFDGLKPIKPRAYETTVRGSATGQMAT